MTYGAGYVDAGYLTLDSLFTSNMTGNAAAFGFRMAEEDWFEVWRRGWPV